MAASFNISGLPYEVQRKIVRMVAYESYETTRVIFFGDTTPPRRLMIPGEQPISNIQRAAPQFNKMATDIQTLYDGELIDLTTDILTLSWTGERLLLMVLEAQDLEFRNRIRHIAMAMAYPSHPEKLQPRQHHVFCQAAELKRLLPSLQTIGITLEGEYLDPVDDALVQLLPATEEHLPYFQRFDAELAFPGLSKEIDKNWKPEIVYLVEWIEYKTDWKGNKIDKWTFVPDIHPEAAPSCLAHRTHR